MPNTRISDLTAATSVAGTDVYPSVQTAGVGPVKTSLTQITAFALANAPAGAVGAPSIAPTGDTNTGFWFPAADTIAASTGGSERLRITSAGNVCIGAQAVVANEVMRLGYAAQNSILLGNTAQDNAGFVGAFNDFSLFGVNRNPSTGVVVNTNKYTAQIAAFGSTTESYISFSTSTVPNVNPTERMRITSAGNVGIGTTLSAWGSQVALQMGGGSAGGISLVGGNQELGANYYITSVGNYTYTANSASTLYSMFGGQHRWFTAASGTAGNTITFTQSMTLTSAGNLLVGTTSSPTTGTQCLTVGTGTAPTATPADTVTLYSSDLSAGNTMPSFYTEGTIVGTGTPTANRTIAVRINGTVYYLLASTIP